MSSRAAAAGAVAALAAIAVAGCGSSQQSTGSASAGGTKSAFPDPTRVDNRFLPLRPGMAYHLRGRARADNDRLVPHDVVFQVTDVTKKIDGVDSVVVFDRDYYTGRLGESELAFFAQDRAGNVWADGEYPEEYSPRGKLDGAPSTWIAGVGRTRAGINMKAHPRTGTTSYLQGFAPSINFADRGKVFRLGARTCVAAGCYRDVLVTEEWSPVDKGAHQLKYYAPGVGNIKVGFKGHDKDAETLQLVEATRMSNAEMAQVRRLVLEQDRRGYRVSPNIYGRTPHAKPAE
jgi:hypothetical protein